MKEQIRQILTDLQRVRENLLTRSNEFARSIDYSNSKTIEFNRAFQECANDFHRASAMLIKKLNEVDGRTVSAGSASRTAKPGKHPVFFELDREEPHRI